MMYSGSSVKNSEDNSDSDLENSMDGSKGFGEKVELVLVSLFISYLLLDLILVDTSRLSFYSI